MTFHLRPFDEADLVLCDRSVTDPDFVGPFEWTGFGAPQEYRRRWTDDRLLGSSPYNLVVAAADGAPVGWVNWRDTDRAGPGAWEIGVLIVPEMRGRGAGSAAHRLLVDYLFTTTTTHRIWAGTEVDNIAEQRTLERCGLMQEGLLRGHHFRDGQWRDSFIYGITRPDYAPPTTTLAHRRPTAPDDARRHRGTGDPDGLKRVCVYQLDSSAASFRWQGWDTAAMDVAADGPSWSDIAAWYDRLVAGGSGPHDTAVRCLIDLAPDLSDATVLDVACGQGLASRALIDAGARRVVGIDATEEMIALARRRDHAGDISYVVDDAQRLSCVDDASVDGATCQLGLMDIPDLDATLASIYRVLRPSGWLVFVVAHPCFMTPEATTVTIAGDRDAVATTGYFDERFWRSSNPEGVRRAGNYHRTLATYLNTVIDAGFVLERIEEPPASPLLAAQQPVYSEVPIFFAARARKYDVPSTVDHR